MSGCRHFDLSSTELLAVLPTKIFQQANRDLSAFISAMCVYLLGNTERAEFDLIGQLRSSSGIKHRRLAAAETE